MKKVLAVIIFSLLLSLASKAQVVILNDALFQDRLSEIKTTVLDSLTNEPLPFASVYVIPSKDTTITNFTLSDAKGIAKLDEVPFGNYVFHVEMMGYKPFIKERYFRERREDMGTIRLQMDEQFLMAAVVSDVGNPVIIKQDTVEFNASSFRVGANAMLKDLLKRMPGMEITEDGKVKFNGEMIDRLTVGGRTFFFDDQSTALNNLPAAVVDKIRVIDRESEQTRASGVQDGSREKVMDVALKKEYEKGWFGNIGLKGGTTLGETEDDSQLRDNRGLLWNGNALVSAYNEKDQLTVIANGQNIDDSNTIVIIYGDDEDSMRSSGGGLSSSAQFGVNANTNRIKDVETTVGLNCKYSDTETGSAADRTTFQEDGNVESVSQDAGKRYASALNADLELKKEKGTVWFHVKPAFRYNKTYSTSNGTSEIFREDISVNRSENKSHSLSDSKNMEFDSDVTLRELWGKKRRSLRFEFSGNYGINSGEKLDVSSLTVGGVTDSRNMNYLIEGNSHGLGGSVRYSEPLGESWLISATAGYTWSMRNSVRDAYDNAGKNDYYSSESRNNYHKQQYDLTSQYKFGERSWITFGGRLIGTLNETFSRSYGIESITGKDDWDWYMVPTIRFQHSKGIDRYNVSVSGYNQRPSSSRILPVLDITNPSRLIIGNVYLKPYTTTRLYGNWSRNNRERFSSLFVYLSGEMNASQISYARWYDTDGILYSVPVNSRKPGFTGTLSANYTTPIDSEKIWSMTIHGGASYSSSVSYQTRTVMPGLNKDNFDYSAFMAGFWGNDAGDRFYEGLSGFMESRTGTFNPSLSFGVKYNREHYSFNLGAYSQGRISRYTLDPSINMNTLDTHLSASASYTTRHEFEIDSDIAYVFYNGYAEGYGLPEWQWNAEISKNIGSINLSIKVHDILNQTRNLTHTVTANYEEDSYSLIMGRYILFGVKWNFGKMNAAHSARAQQAAWNMVF